MKKRNVTTAFQWVFGLAIVSLLGAAFIPQFAGWFLTGIIAAFVVGYVALITHIVQTGNPAMKGSKKRRNAIINFWKEGFKLSA